MGSFFMDGSAESTLGPGGSEHTSPGGAPGVSGSQLAPAVTGDMSPLRLFQQGDLIPAALDGVGTARTEHAAAGRGKRRRGLTGDGTRKSSGLYLGIGDGDRRQ